MRLRKLTAVIVAALGVMGGLPLAAWAGGDNPDCLVTDKAALVGKQKITGTAVVELINFNPSAFTADAADASLVLRFGEAQGVFRVQVPNPLVTSPERVMCDVLAADPTRASDGATIFQAFKIPDSKSLKLCLVVDPVTQKVNCQSLQGLDFSSISGTNNWSGVTGLTIYILD